MKLSGFLFVFLIIIPIAYAQDSDMNGEGRPKSFKPLIVYQDKGFSANHFVPSGYMPTGECIKMDDAFKENCQEGESCIKISYDVACSLKGRHWAGIYWLNPADNWGDRKGGYNLTGAKKMVFWARGENGGEKIAEFRIGGVGQGREYPDTDTASIGPVILSKQWKEYEIDLRDKDLTYISGGFAWIANVDDNSSSCTFYLDNIRYE
ncbi:MAG: hypothetical protein HQL12_03400 [Candidatus Omnitrophica bacterium]|nr:hypothetical protein [Candidatus Omnitrophota bacterium]